MSLPPTARSTVERLLSARFGAPVRVADAQRFAYSSVFRCALDARGSAAPPTVIVRLPHADAARAGPGRLANERAALEFLRSLGFDLAPRYLAGGVDAGLLVTEDLGTAPSLLDLLLGDDAAAARRGLLAFARGLGALHAATAGRAAAFAERRARLGPADPEVAAPLPLTEQWRRVREAAALLRLPRPVGVGRDLAAVARELAGPAGALALSSGDPSPVNCAIAGDVAHFFDFEDACFRHPLLDARVLRFLYPTGGPPWRLPPAVAASLELAYRAALAQAWPAASDDAAYERGMAADCAAWMIARLVRLPKVEAGPDRNPWLLLPPGWAGPVPTRSRRRQLVSIVAACAAAARCADAYPALAAWCDRLVEAWRARWLEASEELPCYPAFATRPT